MAYVTCHEKSDILHTLHVTNNQIPGVHYMSMKNHMYVECYMSRRVKVCGRHRLVGIIGKSNLDFDAGFFHVKRETEVF